MILHTKKRFFRRAFFALLIIGVIGLVAFAATKRVDEEATAISQTGQWVKIIYSPDDKIHYGETPNMEGWDSQGNPNRGTTHHFWTQPNPSSSSTRYVSYCANPSLKPLDGTYQVLRLNDNAEKYQLMKMAIFAGTGGGVNPPAAVQAVANALYNKIFTDSGAATYFANAGLTDNADTRYAYIHAILGALYANDYAGLKNHRQLVDNMIAVLRAEKTNNTDAYSIAQSYSIYRVDRENPDENDYPDGYDSSNYDPDEFQDIVWIESAEFGGINIEKRDANTGTNPQGNGNFANIHFEVRAVGRIYRPDTGGFYNDNDLVTSGNTDAQGRLSFSGLPIGTYKVVETSGNAYYDATVPQTATIYYEGDMSSLVFYDTVKKGSITVRKVDSETGGCTALGSAALSSSTFSIVNRSTYPVVYGGNTIPVGGQLTTGTVPAGQCSISFNNLPYGTYEITETVAGPGYNRTAPVRTVTIPQNNNAVITIDEPNQVKRGDVTFRKIDQNNGNSPMANVAFRIRSNTTGESHIVVTDSNGVVNTSSSFNLHTYRTNGYDSLTFTAVIGEQKHYIYAGYGTWFGNTTPNNSLGALPYDTYTITEMTCFGNKFCYNNDTSSKTFTINADNTVVSLGNWYNDCVVLSLSTVATDQADGDKFVPEGTNVAVVDKINYTLKSGLTYVIHGILMDKNTNTQVSTATKTITPSTNTGVEYMSFNVNTTGLKGHELVAFQEVYFDNVLAIEHKNLNDEGQTVTVVSLSTVAVDKEDNNKFIVAGPNTTVRDTLSYCLKAGKTYSIIGSVLDRTTGQVVMSNGGPVTKSANITPTTNCGTTTMEFDIDTSELAGHDLVVYENIYYQNSPVIAHNVLTDEDQTVTVVSMSTYADDKADNDKLIVDGPNASVEDEITYCLRANKAFRIEGTLMDRQTGEPVMNGGSAVTSTKTITPSTACGVTTMDFDFDATGLGGHDIIVYQKVYFGTSDLVIAEEDINSEDQSVTAVKVSTTATDSSDGDRYVLPGENTVVKDTIHYCLKPGMTFYTVGRLMDAETGRILVSPDGYRIERSKFIEPVGENCGDVEMEFTIDTTEMVGRDVVIYEDIYLDEFGDVSLLKHRDIADEEQTFTVVDLSTAASDNADGDKMVVAGENAQIKDDISYCLKAGREFTIVGTLMDKETGEPVKDARGESVTASKTFTPDTNCGTTSLVFDVDTSALGGHDVVVFERAYDDRDELAVEHADINDEGQTVTIIEVKTTATDKEDGDHYLFPGDTATITDEIHYCLKPGMTFVIEGTLMDKNTGNLIVDNEGNPIVLTTEVNPEQNCGTTSLEFEISTNELAGHDIVVFEKVYLNDVEILDHSDLTDEDQTVTVITLSTIAVDAADGDKLVIADTESEIIDTVSYCLKAGRTYTLIGALMDKVTGELVKGADGELLVVEKELTPDENCGFTTMSFTVDSTELYGHDLVVFEAVKIDDKLIITHEDIDDEAQTVKIINIKTTASDKAGNKYILFDAETTIVDKVEYCLVKDTTYRLVGTLMDKATGEPVLGEDGEPMTQTATFGSNTDCGTVSVEFKLDTTEMLGREFVVFETVYEGDDELISHADLEDWGQTVVIAGYETYASYKGKDSKELELEKGEVVIEDEVKYCLKANRKFTFVGRLMNKNTGEPILIDGKPVEHKTTFTPEEDCGSFIATYTFDVSKIAAGDFIIVIVDDVFDENGDLVLGYHDLNNQDETVILSVPDTGAHTYDAGGSRSDRVIVVLLGAMFAVVVIIVRSCGKAIIGVKK